MSRTIAEHIMSEEQFGALVTANRAKMFRFARSIIIDYDEAQDVVQDVLEKFWTRHRDMTAVDNLEGYMMSSIRNGCLDKIRNSRNRERKHQILRTQAEQTIQIDTDRIDTKATVLRAMTFLPDRQREVVHLRDIEGYEIEEIGKVVGADAPTVRVLLSRGRLKLRDILQGLIS